MRRSALLTQRPDPPRRPHGSSFTQNGLAGAIPRALIPAGSPPMAEVLPGGRGSLLAVVPVNGGSSRMAIVGYLLPEAGEDGHDRSARPDRADGTAADGLVVDSPGYRALVDGRDIGLVLRELELLAFLAANPGRAFPRDALLARVWGAAYQGTARTVDVHIHRLRRKLGPRYAKRLVTVRRVGYMYQPPTSAAMSSR